MSKSANAVTLADLADLAKKRDELKDKIETAQLELNAVQTQIAEVLEREGFAALGGGGDVVGNGRKKRRGKTKAKAKGKKRGRPKGSKAKKFKRGTGKYKPTDDEIAAAIKKHAKLSSDALGKLFREKNKWAVRADRIARIKKEAKKK